MDSPLHLFEGCGIEIEYMIVDRDSLDVRPISDQIFHAIAGEYTNSVDFGNMGWSNELVLHLVEIKCNQPVREIQQLESQFHGEVKKVNQVAEKFNCCLFPTGAHPWMNPKLETKIWPHEDHEIYETYNRIFDCRNHGWSNLQSMHINLPFANDEEFFKLHTAIRVLLPILPALAASSPIIEKHSTGMLDTRLEFYRKNSISIPQITGSVIPEIIRTEKEYEEKILAPMYEEVAKRDPQRVLCYEWVNARGAIPRFERNAIEIRVVDTQECARADIAIGAFVVEIAKKLVSEQWPVLQQQAQVSVEKLSEIFLSVIKNAEKTWIKDASYLKLFDFPDKSCEANDLLRYFFESIPTNPSQVTLANRKTLEFIFSQGTLATRIKRALGSNFSDSKLREIYRQLKNNLAENRLFE